MYAACLKCQMYLNRRVSISQARNSAHFHQLKLISCIVSVIHTLSLSLCLLCQILKAGIKASHHIQILQFLFMVLHFLIVICFEVVLMVTCKISIVKCYASQRIFCYKDLFSLYCVSAHLQVSAWSAHRDQKRVLSLLELELQTVENSHMHARNQVLCKSIQCSQPLSHLSSLCFSLG